MHLYFNVWAVRQSSELTWQLPTDLTRLTYVTEDNMQMTILCDSRETNFHVNDLPQKFGRFLQVVH